MARSLRPTTRRLTLTDLMILIAGFAVGLWVAPEGWDSGRAQCDLHAHPNTDRFA